MQADKIQLEIAGMKKGCVCVTEYTIDSIKNNCVTGFSEALEATCKYTADITDSLSIQTELEPNAFALWVIKPSPKAK